MSTFDVKAQGFASVVTIGDRVKDGVGSSEPSCDAMSQPGIQRSAGHLRAKPIMDSGVVRTVGTELIVSAGGCCVSVCPDQRAPSIRDVTAVREVPNDAAMARYAAGDEEAFAELYDGLAPLIMAYLRRRSHDRALVEDLVQETFLRIHLHRGRYTHDAPVLPWALTIAGRLLANRVRSTRRANAIFVDDTDVSDGAAQTASPEQVAIGRQLAARVQREVLRLPGKDREVFDLVKREGVPLRVAASRLSTSTLALKMRLFRVCGRLRQLCGLSSDADDDERKHR